MTSWTNSLVDLSSWRKIGVSGADALGWLDSLVTADLSGLSPGHARRALLLSPTGRVRAEFTVAVRPGSVLLLQDPIQANPIDRLLAPYVLSSDIELADRTAELALFGLPGATAPPDVPGAIVSEPSCLGAGFDLIAPASDHEGVLRSLAKTFEPIDGSELERWRILRGLPRFGVDGDVDDLPQEAGLEAAVSFDKGCFLGQEAVAKVRNLGHPRRRLLHLRTDGAAAVGQPVIAGDAEAGRVTSATSTERGTVLMASVRWASVGTPLRAASGDPMEPAGT